MLPIITVKRKTAKLASELGGITSGKIKQRTLC